MKLKILKMKKKLRMERTSNDKFLKSWTKCALFSMI